MEDRRSRLLNIIDEGLGDIFAEADDFEKSVNDQLNQVSSESALILKGIVTIKHEMEAVINLFRELIEEQYEWTEAIFERLEMLENRSGQENED
jgi:hypothetical protein